MKKRQVIFFLMALIISVSLLFYGCETADDVSGNPSETVSDAVSDDMSDVSEVSQEQKVDFDFDKFSAAVENTLGLESIDFEGESSISYSMSGMEFDLSDAFKMKIAKDNGNIVASLEETSEMLGLETTTTSYYSDGYLYTAMGDKKMKSSVSFDEVYKKYMPINDISEDLILSSTKEDDDGTTYYILTLNKETMADSSLFKDIEDEMYTMMGADDIDFEFDEMKIKTSFSDDYIDYYEVNGVINVSIDSGETSSLEVPVEFSIYVNVNNPGEDVVVAEPDDLDEYYDVTEID